MEAESSDWRQLVAHHEAGHAVAAIALGVRFELVTVESDECCEGRMVNEVHPVIRAWSDWLENRKGPCPVPLGEDGLPVPSGSLKAWLESQVVVALAGPENQRARTGVLEEDHSQGDLETAKDLAAHATNGRPERLVESSQRRTERLVSGSFFQTCATALAIELVRADTMTFSDVVALLGTRLK